MKYTIWATGLPCSGKTTLIDRLYDGLSDSERGNVAKLDGDIIRTWLSHDLGFSEEDRRENLRRVALLSRFLNEEIGKHVYASFVSPLNSYRDEIARVIGDGFKMVYVNSHIAACERRDVKGMYARARKGEILDFTGIGAPFEIPTNPDLTINTSLLTEPYSDVPIDKSARELREYWNSLEK